MSFIEFLSVECLVRNACLNKRQIFDGIYDEYLATPYLGRRVNQSLELKKFSTEMSIIQPKIKQELFEPRV